MFITQMPEQRVSWKWGRVVPICCGHICSMLVSGQTQEWASKVCSGGHWLPSLGHQHQSSSCRSTSHPSGESGHYAVLQEKPKILASDFFFVLVTVGRFLLLPSKAMIPFFFPRQVEEVPPLSIHLLGMSGSLCSAWVDLASRCQWLETERHWEQEEELGFLNTR